VKTLLLLVLVLTGCNNQSTDQTVDQFKKANDQVNKIANEAAPHVTAIFDQVFAPAIENVKNQVNTKNQPDLHLNERKQKDSASAVVAVQKPISNPPTWTKNSDFKYCYPISQTNIECRSEPKDQ
jgi:uncharacterized lipoprotein NlpE involved in copper resistance